MAATLALSPATVRNYLSNAIAKVGARNRIDAIRIAHGHAGGSDPNLKVSVSDGGNTLTPPRRAHARRERP